MTEPGPVLFVAWTATSGRATDISAVLGGDAMLVHPRVDGVLRHPVSTAVRYALSLLLTGVALVRRRPSVVVVTNPPLFPPLLVAVWAAVTRKRFVMDSHPSAFGLKGKAVLAKLQPVHRWLARHAAGVLVTTEELAREVNGWGGNGIVLHEAPVPFPAPTRPDEPVVLFVGIFSSDEPVDVVVDAARRLPHVRFRITGDPARAPKGLVEGSPGNVEYVGYLQSTEFRAAVSSASLVLTLTTEPASVMRSAYEAVYARVPVVMTGTAVLRETFPHAVFCDNTGESIAEAITGALATYDSLVAATDDALALQHTRWEGQLARLRAACGLPA